MQAILDLREQLQEFATFRVAFLVSLLSLVLILLLTMPFRKKEGIGVETGANLNKFIVRLSRRDTWGLIIAFPFWVVNIFMWSLFMPSHEAEILFAGMAVLLTIVFFVFVLRSAYMEFWKLQIEGGQIHFRSLFRRKSFFFHHIKFVKAKYWHACKVYP